MNFFGFEFGGKKSVVAGGGGATGVETAVPGAAKATDAAFKADGAEATVPASKDRTTPTMDDDERDVHTKAAEQFAGNAQRKYEAGFGGYVESVPPAAREKQMNAYAEKSPRVHEWKECVMAAGVFNKENVPNTLSEIEEEIAALQKGITALRNLMMNVPEYNTGDNQMMERQMIEAERVRVNKKAEFMPNERPM